MTPGRGRTLTHLPRCVIEPVSRSVSRSDRVRFSASETRRPSPGSSSTWHDVGMNPVPAVVPRRFSRGVVLVVGSCSPCPHEIERKSPMRAFCVRLPSGTRYWTHRRVRPQPGHRRREIRPGRDRRNRRRLKGHPDDHNVTMTTKPRPGPPGGAFSTPRSSSATTTPSSPGRAPVNTAPRSRPTPHTSPTVHTTILPEMIMKTRAGHTTKTPAT